MKNKNEITLKEYDENEIPVETIIDKFKQLNINLTDDKDQLISDLNQIYNEYDKIKNRENFIYDKNEELNSPYDIDNNKLKIDYSLIGKMIYFNKKCFKFIPRKIQIISLIYFLKKKESVGLIQQVNTGEGKSVIISFLAVYLALIKKKKIDILTSSPILAKRDAILFKDFYNSFGLTVDYSNDHNNETKGNNTEYTQDSYQCYKSDIVYGDTLSLEGDILRTNFMGIRGRGKERMFDCIIIDEIDNIAIDNLKNTTELLDCFHGYKFLEYVYFYIFKKLKEMTDNKDEKIINKERDNIIKQLRENCFEEFKDLKILREKKVFIPEHLEEYINKRLDDWCESAYIAKFIYHNNEHYVINNDKEYDIDVINPIDFYNTGVTQKNSVWSGLHQFLQIHEKQMLTEDNLSSCYMSNLTFFKKYIKKDENNNIIENNIYGLTGTIGSKYNKETLNKLYNLDTLIIPPFKDSLLKIEKPIITLIKEKKEKNIKSNKEYNNQKNRNNLKSLTYEEKWYKDIEDKIIEIIEKGRAILVIFQYINDAITMSKKLKNKGKKFKNIIIYSRSDRDEGKFLEHYIEPGNIILSTNISGRGTDIKISSKLNKNGGLHVILAYEPFNPRIERQAFGRAGRKGENGSAQKIVISPMNEEETINETNKREEEESNFLIKFYSKKLNVFEKIFEKFSEFLEEKYEITHDESILLDLKERWGIFLIKNNMNNIEKEYKKDNSIDYIKAFQDIEKKYDIFEKELNDYSYKLDLKLTTLTNTYIKAKNFVSNLGCNKKTYEFQNALYLNKTKDIEKIKLAIEMSPNLCLGGYMLIIVDEINKMQILIKDRENEKNKRQIKSIISDIDKNIDSLINKIELLIEQFQTYQKIIGNLGYNKIEFDLSKQNMQKINLMKAILELMERNKQKFNEFKNKNYSYILKVTRISLKDLIKINNLDINELVIEYFREYGLYLFILKKIENENEKKNNENCLIF